ncbi:hypothetical protein B0H16DRAFT_1564678 [Mycena metata]|uniref:Uncharacterized protein n=1 Tax=Mycena metata TaxID=1033252 RepID=A0AAD7IFG4_9AGAR|nr:hypothetical protein B0H16DRAFT_1564678 [Mycena metata]
MTQCELISSLWRNAWRIWAKATRGILDNILRRNARMLSRSCSVRISFLCSHNSLSSSGPSISSSSAIISSRVMGSSWSTSSSKSAHSSESMPISEPRPSNSESMFDMKSEIPDIESELVLDRSSDVRVGGIFASILGGSTVYDCWRTLAGDWKRLLSELSTFISAESLPSDSESPESPSSDSESFHGTLLTVR